MKYLFIIIISFLITNNILNTTYNLHSIFKPKIYLTKQNKFNFSNTYNTNCATATNNCWENKSIPGPSRHFNDVFTFNANLAWAVNNDGEVQRTIDGNKWNNVHSIPSCKFLGIHFVNENSGWCVGTNGKNYKTTNGGKTGYWVEQTALSNDLNSVFFINELKGWIVDSKGYIYSTTNGGINYSKKLVASNSLKDIFFIDEKIGWAIGSSNFLYKTTDGGDSWNPIKIPNASLSPQFNAIHFITTTIGFIAGNSVDKGSIFKTLDGGITWKPTVIAIDCYINEISFTNLKLGWAVGQEGQNKGIVFETNDGGETWKNITNMLPFYDEQFGGVSFDINSNGWIVGNSGTIFKYTCGNNVSCRESDSLELIKLYNSTGGANWNNKWNLSTPINSWFGIQLNKDNCVHKINLTNNNLNGNLPILNLNKLDSLLLGQNLIYGSIFTSNLPNLIALDLSNNKFVSKIQNIDHPKLRYLNLSSNSLFDTLPVLNLPQLELLDLSLNNILGKSPIINSNNLRNINISNNKLSGKIPNYTQTTLTYLNLSFNLLTDTIPNFNLPNLQNLILNNNKLIGIGYNFSMPNLVNYAIYNNNISGTLPIELAKLTKLKYIYLHNNYFEGCYPIEYKIICSLNFSTNNLVEGYNFTGNSKLPWKGNLTDFCNNVDQLGAICDDADSTTLNDKIDINCKCNDFKLATCSRLNDSLELIKFYSYLNGQQWTNNMNWVKTNTSINQWHGIELSNDGCIDSIVLSNNNLKGNIYNIDFGSILHINLSNNKLDGNIPNFTKINNIKSLDLSNNLLKGPIPSLNLLNNLNVLDISYNNFTFTGLKYQINKNYIKFTYSPQNKILTDTTYYRVAGQFLHLDLNIDQNLVNNVYQWYKNGIKYKLVNSNKLEFNNLQVGDSGLYYVEVTNPDVPGLTLYSHDIKLVVIDNRSCYPESSESCDSVKLICSLDELNGFSCINKSLSPSLCNPLCIQGGVGHNTSWWGFVSQGGLVTMNLTVGSCVNNQGIQFGIWGDCNCQSEIFCNSIPYVPSNSVKEFKVDLQPCKVYYLWIDGNNGDICDFTINTSGGGPVNLQPLSSINEESDKIIEIICQDSCDYNFYVKNQSGNCKNAYLWTLNGIDLNQDSNLIKIKLTTNTDFTLCVSSYIGNLISNSICEQKGPECSTIRVRNSSINIDIKQNIITPNNDGLNDKFEIDNIPVNLKLCIINKWGAKVFCQNNYTNNWEGTDNTNSPLPDGVYIFILSRNDGTTFRNGTITIKRI